MKSCNHCGTEIEYDDNFCANCGELTIHGYSFFNSHKENQKLLNGNVSKQSSRTLYAFEMFAMFVIIFIIMIVIRGQNMFKPIIYLEKQMFKYNYGYETSLIINNNQYYNKEVNSLNEAYSYIKSDFQNQNWKCKNDVEVYRIEDSISQNHGIPSVTLCDVSPAEALKIQNVIDEMFTLFPESSGYLTNITITNAKTNKEYVAYFQPIYQFVNSNQDINKYNKINKTQILLNSYYFLNDNILKTKVTDNVGKNWYVNDATWESLIAHEFGHYLNFTLILKENNIGNITFITKDNYSSFNKALDIVNSSNFSDNIVSKALDNYNNKYKTNISIKEFATGISEYASAEKEGKLQTDETIAEAVHDYYLHRNNASKESLEIVNIMRNKV